MDIPSAERLIRTIRKRRDCGWFVGGVRDIAAKSVGEAAAEFGLSADKDVYEEIRPGRANVVLTTVLYKDRAYGTELMPLAEAVRLSDAFISLFDVAQSRYYTNVDDEFYIGSSGCSWNPATRRNV